MQKLKRKYNSEKKKIQTKKSPSNPRPKSSWVLFNHLEFLNDYPQKTSKQLQATKSKIIRKKKNPSNVQDQKTVSAATSSTSAVNIEKDDVKIKKEIDCDDDVEIVVKSETNEFIENEDQQT